MTKFAMISTRNGMSLVVNDKPYNVDSSHSKYPAIVLAIKEKRYDELGDLINIAAAIATYATNADMSTGRITVADGEVFFNGTPVHNTITDRIISMMSEGFDIDPMLKFLDNMMNNPSFRAVTQLYGFLEACKLPITDDGCFLAYKVVRGDFKDKHTGTFDNSPGTLVTVPRNTVDEDPEQTCSTGLHVCSLSYIAHFSSGSVDKTLIVKVNPRDVVAIPRDYNNAKMRCCGYQVIGIYKGDRGKEAFSSTVVDDNNLKSSAPNVDWHPEAESKGSKGVKLVRDQGMSVADAAARLDCHPSTIRKALARAPLA